MSEKEKWRLVVMSEVYERNEGDEVMKDFVERYDTRITNALYQNKKNKNKKHMSGSEEFQTNKKNRKTL